MLKGLLIALILFLVVFPLLRCLFLLAANSRAGQLAELRRQAGGLLFPLCRCWLTAIAADLVVMPLYWLGLLGGDHPESAGDPVVLVHGLYHNRTAWVVLERRLRRVGIGNISTYQYNSFTSTFDPAVAGLARHLDRLLGGRKETRVVLIGHSLGGLVCRAVAGDPRYRDRIAGLVTLGSPHGGSALGWFGPNRMARDLIPGRHISRCMDGVEDPDCPRLSLYSPVDDYVCPLFCLGTGRSGWLEESCPPIGHVWMIFSSGVASRIIDFMSSLCRV
ncbi:esterase/lipase family protein [Pseudodesulfovibrio sp.]|uniref:esterase/lipase family protein n=1 Tax=unclassified Pseudodesulfovibrio TaxID=2661612 RepID=UPI003B008D61